MWSYHSIPDIQGTSLNSCFRNETIQTQGVITSISGDGFYLQDPFGDGNEKTSDAIFVFTDSTPMLQVGDWVELTGKVIEFTPPERPHDLSLTRIIDPAILAHSSKNSIPEAVVLGYRGRIPPNEGNGIGIRFFESMEAMRVTVKDAIAVSPINRYGEIFVLSDQGKNATGVTDRGTIKISPTDFNPERIQLHLDQKLMSNAPSIKVGDRLGDVTGVLDYNYGNYEVKVSEPLMPSQSSLKPETTYLQNELESLTIATYNVQNLDPNDNDGDRDIALGKFITLGKHITENLRSPDIIALQEIQDSDGAIFSSILDAKLTLKKLVNAVVLEGGPSYEFIDHPFLVGGKMGGQPGANIRVAFLYNPRRVKLAQGSVKTIGPIHDGGTLDVNPFENSRLPLIATFQFGKREITVINNHFSSKFGSSPLFGRIQPPINGQLEIREYQAQAVYSFAQQQIQEFPSVPVVVLGDLNDFEFSSPLTLLTSQFNPLLFNMSLEIPKEDRYSYLYQGNAQMLDHILVSSLLLDRTDIDVVHLNTEFTDSVSDHDPVLVSLNFTKHDCILNVPNEPTNLLLSTDNWEKMTLLTADSDFALSEKPNQSLCGNLEYQSYLNLSLIVCLTSILSILRLIFSMK